MSRNVNGNRIKVDVFLLFDFLLTTPPHLEVTTGWIRPLQAPFSPETRITIQSVFHYPDLLLHTVSIPHRLRNFRDNLTVTVSLLFHSYRRLFLSDTSLPSSFSFLIWYLSSISLKQYADLRIKEGERFNFVLHSPTQPKVEYIVSLHYRSLCPTRSRRVDRLRSTLLG